MEFALTIYDAPDKYQPVQSIRADKETVWDCGATD
jgi:hypothetical protein